MVAPLAYMVKPGFAERLTKFVENGGTLIGTYMTGIADETDRSSLGISGPTSQCIWPVVEETDALYPEETNQIIMNENRSLCLPV